MDLPLFTQKYLRIIFYSLFVLSGSLFGSAGDFIWYEPFDIAKHKAVYHYPGSIGPDGKRYDLGDQHTFVIYDNDGLVSFSKNFLDYNYGGTSLDVVVDAKNNRYFSGSIHGKARFFGSSPGNEFKTEYSVNGDSAAILVKYNAQWDIEWGVVKPFVGRDAISRSAFGRVVVCADDSIAVIRVEIEDISSSHNHSQTKFLEKYSPKGELLFSRELKGQVFDTDLALHPSGGLIVSGRYHTVLQYGEDGDEVFEPFDFNPFVAMFDCDGTLKWIKDVSPHNPHDPTDHRSYLSNVQFDANGNILVFGSIDYGTTETGFVLMLNLDGSYRGIKRYTGIPKQLFIDQYGKIVIVFNVLAAQEFKAGEKAPKVYHGDHDLVLVRYTSNLNVLWQKRLSGVAEQRHSMLAPTPDGHLYWSFSLQENAYYTGEPFLIVGGRIAGGRTRFIVAKVSLDDGVGTQMTIPSGASITEVSGILHKGRFSLSYADFAQTDFAKFRITVPSNPFAGLQFSESTTQCYFKFGDALFAFEFDLSQLKGEYVSGHVPRVRMKFSERKRFFNFKLKKTTIVDALYRYGAINADVKDVIMTVPVAIHFPDLELSILANGKFRFSAKEGKKGKGKSIR